MKSLFRTLGALWPYHSSPKPTQPEEIKSQNEVLVETSQPRTTQLLDEPEDEVEPGDLNPPDHVQDNDNQEDKVEEVLPYIRPDSSGLASILATTPLTRGAKSLDDAPKRSHVRRSIQFTTDATAEKPSSKQPQTDLHQKSDESTVTTGSNSKRSSLILSAPPRSPKNGSLNVRYSQSGTSNENQDGNLSSSNTLFNISNEPPVGSTPNLTGRVKQVNSFAEFEGSHSSIFLGLLDAKKVAIKVFRGMRFTEETSEKVKREREIWWRLRHENVLPLLGFTEEPGRYGALIYPWCEGGNTANYLRKPGKPPERFQLWSGVVKGIGYLHSHDPPVIHGDLKPTNVLIGEGKARLCDFGILRLLEEETMGMTTTSAHIGTMRYLAPELVAADDQPTTTPYSDVYALGCLGLEFLFLRIPYADRRNPAQIFKDIAEGVPPSKILPMAEEPSEPIKLFWNKLEECWNSDPVKRPTAHDLQDFVEINRADILAALENFVPAPGLLE